MVLKTGQFLTFWVNKKCSLKYRNIKINLYKNKNTKNGIRKQKKSIKKENKNTAECGKYALCRNIRNYNWSMISNNIIIQNMRIKKNLVSKNIE